ncbi:ABC transporter ATP-binding protein/permease [Aliidiomarina haloalkalitolerans]|uniref:Thiol reductant ABC exporter subunit CydD n=1 Tax=Aliidiomarina haloalkalitolerans TaxID=859059 RepID=A0A432VYR5_9GAMM|nr:ABC transporter transmembrane domain-containing protein [Aliidiomarina haloalkalitolerans]RUO21806.1 thiol reductant ABC exporter subunit CydD [Aliidiomarina haloalkalitolerans]
MRTTFQLEKAYLNQLGAASSRSLLWARCWGSIHAIATVIQLGLMAWLVQLFFQQHIESITAILVALFVTILVRAGSGYGHKATALRAAESAKNSAQQRLLEHWHWQLTSGEWQQQRNTNAANDYIEPIEQLSGYFGRYKPQVWLAVWQPLVILAVVFYLNWLAGLFLLISAPLIPLFMALIGMGAERIHQQHILSVQRLAGIFIDRVRNLTLLFLMQKLPVAQRQVEKANDEYRQLNMKTLRVAFLSSAVLEFFAAIAIAALAIYIGFSLLGYYSFPAAEQLTLFSGLFILLLAPEFFQPLRQLSQFYHDRAAALGAASVLSEQTKAASPSKEHAAHFPLQTKSMTFQYATRDQVFLVPAMAIEEGQVVLLKGVTGSGKSTILQLLAGLLPGLEITTSKGQQLQATDLARIGYLPQSPWLSNASVLQNLCALLPEAQQDYVFENTMESTLLDEAMIVCQQLGLEQTLARLPLGLHSHVSELGAGLSGGEAKRLALGRWLLAVRLGFSPQILLLDEPSAGLDSVSASYVHLALLELKKQGVTTVIASHAAHFDDLADIVVNLDETGTSEAPCG